MKVVISNYSTEHALVNPFNAELNPICHLLALLGAHHIFHVSELSVNKSTAIPVRVSVAIFCEITVIYKSCNCIQ